MLSLPVSLMFLIVLTFPRGNTMLVYRHESCNKMVQNVVFNSMENFVEIADRDGSFSVSVLTASKSSRVVLFAAGAGGNPRRHMPLLQTLADHGFTVVAPHFERVAGHAISEADLSLRIRRLALALDYAAGTGHPVDGIGHSIGAAMLIGLSGGQMWMRHGEKLDIAAGQRIERLVLFTPATDFFRAPGALDGVHAPMQVWAGELDDVTPPSQTLFLKNALGDLVDARVVPGAGHFSFMNELPPHVTDSLENREAFLDHLARETRRFLLA
ncbi:alpha/beta hydrolase [Noviherbaspirillum galbum]|uniref:Alpha/beta hydrolase n=1 Tax=Noviherbaspirillum galbum TaxID=2709383 RepID=A0A6B3SSP6_9BURK|nr:alpha/beta hydrolase [Noviherbaspirillum galbum]NEX62375.1 alpha/beta hydrolase [Noviherbaspirillum galbum]